MMLITESHCSMVRVQTRISDGLEVLQFFTMRQWNFRYDNFIGIEKYLKGKDKEAFSVDTEHVESVAYMKDTILGGRQFCLKEPLSTLPKARMQLKA